MAKRRRGKRGSKAKSRGITAARLAAAPLGPRTGTLSLVCRVWSTVDPADSVLEANGCPDQPNLIRMLMLDPEDGLIAALRQWLASHPIHVADGTKNTTVLALDQTLTSFCVSYNPLHPTATVQLVTVGDCSAPGHISTGAGGCRPVGVGEEGHSIAIGRMVNGRLREDFGQFHSNYTTLEAEVGYLISVKLQSTP